MKRTYTVYKVKTAEKKNVFTTSTYSMPDEGVAKNKTFYINEIYRWGEATLEVEGDCVVEAFEDPYNDPFYLDSYNIIDQDFEDGCSLEFKFEEDDEWTDEEKAFVEQLFDNDSYTGFDDHGIYCDDFSARFYGPLEIEKGHVEEREVEEVKGTWPF